MHNSMLSTHTHTHTADVIHLGEFFSHRPVARSVSVAHMIHAEEVTNHKLSVSLHQLRYHVCSHTIINGVEVKEEE